VVTWPTAEELSNVTSAGGTLSGTSRVPVDVGVSSLCPASWDATQAFMLLPSCFTNGTKNRRVLSGSTPSTHRAAGRLWGFTG